MEGHLSHTWEELIWTTPGNGDSVSEIASLREVKEKTVRQQATSIYAKSGTGSRAEFSASFLEDLLSSSAEPPVTEKQYKVA